MVKAENLTYDYPGFRALDNVSFELREGSVTALVGPNGAGKTTLMRCLASLASPASGNIHINGIDVLENPQKNHSQTGYLSDFFGLYDNLPVHQNLRFLANAQKLGDQADKRVEEVIALLGLEKYRDNYAKTLSRGWRQRLGIAMSIIHQPKLLILDEPASGLDPEARMHLSQLVLKLNQEGMTLLVSSHILAELEDYSTDILIMDGGRIVENKIFSDTAKIGGKRMRMRMSTSNVMAMGVLSAFDGVTNAIEEDKNIFFDFTGGEDGQVALIRELVTKNIALSSFDEMKKDLQAEYLNTLKTEKAKAKN